VYIPTTLCPVMITMPVLLLTLVVREFVLETPQFVAMATFVRVMLWVLTRVTLSLVCVSILPTPITAMMAMLVLLEMSVVMDIVLDIQLCVMIITFVPEMLWEWILVTLPQEPVSSQPIPILAMMEVSVLPVIPVVTVIVLECL